MKRSWPTWLLFSVALSVVLCAMGWVSLKVLELDESQRQARAQTQREETLSLALWRMESLLGPILAQENARPYFAYTAFYPAQRAYTCGFNDLRPGETPLPSSLLLQDAPFVRLHFQVELDHALTSPQVPLGPMRDLCLNGYRSADQIDDAAERLEQLRGLVSVDRLLAHFPAEPAATTAPAPQYWQQEVSQQPAQQIVRGQGPENVLIQEQQARFKQNVGNNGYITKAYPQPIDVREGYLQPIWIDDALILARRICVTGCCYVQGCWMDWPALREHLLAEVADLLPNADLRPVLESDGDERTHFLAALPLQLVAPPALDDAPLAAGSPLRLSLIIVWIGVLLAGAAVGALLLGALKLSERRGTFVSAVTHELRTPLTTFRMYTEMLDEGMVTDEQKRKRYLQVLRGEANRLSHLVENVLAYARLERGRAAQRIEALPLAGLIERIRGRLEERARRDDMRVEVSIPDGEPPLRVTADAGTVEQILLNLVDNACKYANGTDDRAIRVTGHRNARFAAIRVRDHGPGIPKRRRSRLFRPFSKSAADAANSAPGIGLGLALSRRLARTMGGDLRFDDRTDTGACFVLTLPIADDAPSPQEKPSNPSQGTDA